MSIGPRDIATPLPFVGRTPELEDLTDRVAAVQAGAGGLVLVSGDAGIGKTRLVERAVAAHPGPVAWAACPAAGGAPPFWPWRTVLRRCVSTQTPEAGAPWPDVRLLIADKPGALPDGASRFRVFEAVAATLAEAGQPDGLVVVVDDLQWADEGSVRLLQFLASELRHAAVLLMSTYRNTELEEGHPLVDALPDLARFGPQITLGGLSPAEVESLYRSFRAVETGTRDEQQIGSRLYDQTGGNPFFVGELLRLLPSDKTFAPVELPSLALSRGGVASVLNRRLARLPQTTYDVLLWAAVDGPTVDVDILAAVSGFSAGAVLVALDPGVTARVLVLNEAGSLAFAHDLWRETLLASLALSERIHRHWELGLARASTAGDDVDRTSSAAEHLMAGVAVGDVHEAVRWAAAAAERAMRVLAYENAAAWYEQAVTTRQRFVAPDETEAALLLALGSARLDAGHLAEGREAFLTAARLARERGDADQLAEAALGLGAGLGGFEVSLFDQWQIDLLEEALAALPERDDPLRAWVLARLSVAVAFSGSVDRRRRLAEDAIAMGQRLDDDEVRAYALAAWCDSVSGPDHVEERLAAAGDVIHVAAAAGLRPLELLGRRLRVVALLERGDLDGAALEVAAFERSADVLRQPLYRWYVPLWRATLSMTAGDMDRAAALTNEAERLGVAASSQNARTLVRVQRFVQLRSCNRFEEASRLAAEMLHEVQDVAAPESLEGAWLVGDVVTGRSDHARRRADAVVSRGIGAARSDSEWLPDVAQLAEVAVALRHEPLARLVFEALQPYGDLFVVEGIGAAVCGPVAYYLAETARLAGRLDEADRYSARAEQLCSAAGAILSPAPLTTPAERVERPRPDESAELGREGDVWAITYAGTTVRVRDAKGLRDLAVLLRSPGRAVHVSELTGAPLSSTHEDLDATAVAAYRRRLGELEEEVDAAEAGGDLGWAAKLVAERDFIVGELRGAVGIGGRLRRSGDPVERSRKAVTARIRDSIERIVRVHPTLGRHLRNSIRTGTWCCYEPEWPVKWRFR